MLKNSDDKKMMGDRSSVKNSSLFRNRFIKIAVPVVGGIIIGLLATLIMKFMSKYISL